MIMPASKSPTDTDLLTDRYNREAVAYRDLWAPVLRIAGAPFLNEIPANRVARVLDLGTGVGGLVPDIQRRFPEALILGVDRAPGMLALSVDGHPRAVMDAAELAIPSESMDVVLLVFMLFHVPDPEAALREVRRVLKSGGILGCITWAEDLESPASRTWNDCLETFGAAPADPAVVTRHDRFNTPDKIAGLLEEIGFKEVRCREADLIARIDIDHLLELKTSMGSMKPRFDSLSPELQKACVSEARRRMSGVSPEEFTARGRTVNATARR
jgi:SAM-dependent methyltransferase